MDNLGVAMNDTTLKAYAQEKGLGELSTTYDKVNVAMQMFLEKTEYAAGNYEKENKTLAGALNTAKAALENFMSGAGNVDDLADSFINASEVIIESLDELVPALTVGFAELISELSGELISMIIDNAPELIEAAIDVVVSIVDAIEDNADKIAEAAVTVAEAFINGIQKMFPQILSVASKVIQAFAEEIGKANPILAPFMSIISSAAQNIDAMAVAFISGSAAINIYKSGIEKLNALEKAHTLISTAANGQLTMSSTLVGLLTGKITAQTAATNIATIAQTAFNAALKAIPVMLAVAGIAALVAGIYKLFTTLTQETEAEKAHRLAVEENRKAIEESAKAIKQRNEAMAESASEGLSQISHTKTLADELLRMADADGKVAESERGRAEFILGELNSALGTEYQMVNGQIQAMGQLEQSIYDVINAQKLKILSEAAEKTYAEAIKKKQESLDNLATAYQEAQPYLEEYAQKQQAVNEAEKQLAEFKAQNAGRERESGYYDELLRLENQLYNATTAEALYLEKNKEVLNTYWQAEDVVDEQTAAITRYGDAMDLANTDVEGACDVLEEYITDASKGTLATDGFAEGSQEALADLGSDVESKLHEYTNNLKAFNKTGSKHAESLVIESGEQLKELVEKYKAAGGDINDGFITSFNAEGIVQDVDISAIIDKLPGLEEKAASKGLDFSSGYAAGILEGEELITTNATDITESALESVQTTQDSNSPAQKTISLGSDFSSGYAQGISAGEVDVVNAAVGLTNAALAAVKQTQDSDSPAKETDALGGDFTDGFVVGIESGIGAVETAAIKMTTAAIESAKKALKINNCSAVARDEIGKMITKGIAVGIDDGKTEVQKVMEKWEKEAREEATKELTEAEKEYDKAFNEITVKRKQQEKQRREEEYQERLKNAKTTAERNKIIRDYELELEKEADEEELDRLEEKAKKERELADKEAKALKELEDAKRKDIENHKQAILDSYDELVEKITDDIAKIEDLQNDMSDKLKDNGELFSVVTETFTSNGYYDDNGEWVERKEEITHKYGKLADLDEQREANKRYTEAILAVKERGVPQGVLDELRGMSVEEGTMYAEALLNASDDEFKDYIDDWNAIQAESDEQAKLLYSDESNAVLETFTEAFGTDIPAEFFKIGEKTADEFGGGFMQQLGEVFATSKDILTGLLMSLMPGGASADSTTVNNDSTYNYYFQPAAGESTQQQIQSVEDYNMKNEILRNN